MKVKIKFLSWDTEFFGRKIGRLDIINENNFNVNDFNKEVLKEKYELIYIHKYGNILEKNIQILLNLELMDVMLAMIMKFERQKYLSNEYNFRTELKREELNQCCYIAESMAHVSRFYREKLIGEQRTVDLYKKWIENSTNQIHSDGLFIEKNGGVINGIHLIKTDEINKKGYFTLTGVLPFHKRSGIGRNLWNQSFGYWANNYDLETIESPFSLQNIESFNFHLKMGFNFVKEIKYIYHYRNH